MNIDKFIINYYDDWFKGNNLSYSRPWGNKTNVRGTTFAYFCDKSDSGLNEEAFPFTRSTATFFAALYMYYIYKATYV